MERLQPPLNSCLFGEHLEVNCLEQSFVDYAAESLRFDEEEQFLISSLEDNMPFLQMLQSVEYSQQQQQQQCFFNLKEPTFQTLLRLQHMKNHHQNHNYNHNHDNNIINNNVHQAATEAALESCVTHDMVEMHSHYSHSPVKSESYELQQQNQVHQNSTFSSSVIENKVMSYECNQEQTKTTEQAENNNNKTEQGCSNKSQLNAAIKGEKRKRKRTRPAKNKEDVENQRMTHIAVERNRRRQMNDHLSVLRSLMPPSYIQRGDQASIIGGAIDFVKELEQLLQSLEAQKRVRNINSNNNEEVGFGSNNLCIKPSIRTIMQMQSYGMRSSSSSPTSEEEKCNGNSDVVNAENKSGSAEIEVTLIQTHVNLKIQCQRKQGQLVKAIVALEDLRLSILHLNITSSLDSVLYSLNLKIEEGCKLSTANEIAEAVHHIFNFING